MKKMIITLMLFPIIVLFTFYAVETFAIFRKSASGSGSLDAATWSISRSTSQQDDSIDVIPGVSSDTYDLTVQSASEVNVTYTIIISNLPASVDVSLDGGSSLPRTNNEIRVTAGTINYNDSIKTRTHTLTFSAPSGTQPISEQEIDIDVLFKQTL